MSVISTTPILVAPSAAGPTALHNSGVLQQYGNWVEFIASASGNNAIAGLMLGTPNASSYAGGVSETQVGVGTAGNEVALGTLAFITQNTGSPAGPGAYQLPVAMGGITNGQRVALRWRGNSTSYIPTNKLMYYSGLSSDQVTSVTQVFSVVPSGSLGVTVAANTSAWANSNWIQLTSGIASPIGIYGVAVTPLAASTDVEIDLGTGTGGAESVITTIRWGVQGVAGDIGYCFLSGLYSVAANTRVAIRIRKSGTDSGNYAATLLYVTNVSAIHGKPAKGKGGKGNPGVNQFFPGGTIIANIGNPGVGIVY